MEVTVGLDFGTYQTKVCYRINREGLEKFEFVNFASDNDQPNYFFLSKVQVNKDGKIYFGKNDVSDVNHTFENFKIASAEDEDFRLVSGLKSSLYEDLWKDKITPEVISVIYLIYVIGYVKGKVEKKYQVEKDDSTPAFLKQFQGVESGKEEISFRFQMGIPTEYSKEVNILRRRKFEQILLMGVMLSNWITFDRWEYLVLDDVIEMINELFSSLTVYKDSELWDQLLEEHGVSIMPETAAGLIYLVKSGKVKTDKYYMSLDIGGGSSDISFFKVENDKTFTYLASESVMIASNNVFKAYQNKKRIKADNFEYALTKLSDREDLMKDENYKAVFDSVIRKLNKVIYRIYNKRVYFRFRHGVANEKYKDTICYFFGGGTQLPVPLINPEKYFSEIVLHNNGVNNVIDMEPLSASIQPIDDLTINLEIAQTDWLKYMRTLVVALGLSLNRPADHNNYWSLVQYQPGENYERVDPGLYDVVKRRWV